MDLAGDSISHFHPCVTATLAEVKRLYLLHVLFIVTFGLGRPLQLLLGLMHKARIAVGLQWIVSMRLRRLDTCICRLLLLAQALVHACDLIEIVQRCLVLRTDTHGPLVDVLEQVTGVEVALQVRLRSNETIILLVTSPLVLFLLITN